MCRMPKTLPHRRVGYWPITLGDCTHILGQGMAKGALVGRSDVSSRGEDCKAKSDEKQGRKNTPDLYPTPISPRPYHTCQCLGSN